MSRYKEFLKIVAPILNKDGVRICSIGRLFLLCEKYSKNLLQIYPIWHDHQSWKYGGTTFHQRVVEAVVQPVHLSRLEKEGQQ